MLWWRFFFTSFLIKCLFTRWKFIELAFAWNAVQLVVFPGINQSKRVAGERVNAVYAISSLCQGRSLDSCSSDVLASPVLGRRSASCGVWFIQILSAKTNTDKNTRTWSFNKCYLRHRIVQVSFTHSHFEQFVCRCAHVLTLRTTFMHRSQWIFLLKTSMTAAYFTTGLCLIFD